jgi:hypothetical protein
VLVDDLEKLLVKFCVVVKLFGVNWHANGSLTEKCLCAPLRCAQAFGRSEGAAPTGSSHFETFPRPDGLGSIILSLRDLDPFERESIPRFSLRTQAYGVRKGFLYALNGTAECRCADTNHAEAR